ncbi:MAG: alpha/beta hydrolase [Chitinophagaceae bacterium]|nr:alpha/beta hydrolase [Chitinophagaceae bacterium]
MASHQIEIKGKKIIYYLYGSGKPVVFIHGFGEDHSIWQNQIAHFKNQYQLIIPDLPGSGTSELVNDMSIEGMADIVKNIADDAIQTPNEKIIIIGHSMGGYIALAFAEKYPDAPSGLGLFHSTSYADSKEKIITRKKGIEFIETHGASSFLRTTLPNLFSLTTKESQPELIEQLIENSGNFSASTLVTYYESMINRPDRRNILENIKLPVLSIFSENDQAVPLSDSLEQSILPGKSYITILKNSGHMGMLEDPIESNIALARFLNDC